MANCIPPRLCGWGYWPDTTALNRAEATEGNDCLSSFALKSMNQPQVENGRRFLTLRELPSINSINSCPSFSAAIFLASW